MFYLRLAGGIINQETVEVKRLVTRVILAVPLVGIVLFDLSDTDISVADTSIPNDEVASNVSKVRNSSASARTTITMTGILDE